MITVLVIMIVGMICGYLLKEKKKILRVSEKMTTAIIFVLLFILGIGVGLNEKVISGIDIIGWQAMAITLGSIFGSVILSFITYKLFFTSKNEK